MEAFIVFSLNYYLVSKLYCARWRRKVRTSSIGADFYF